MPDELQLVTRTHRGQSVGATYPILTAASLLAPIPANTTSNFNTQLTIPMQRGQIFVPEYLGGFLGNNAAAGAAGGTLIQAYGVAFEGSVTLRVWLASFTTQSIFGGAQLGIQCTDIDEIDPLEAIGTAAGIISGPMGIAINWTITNGTAGSINYTGNILLRYHMRFVNQ